MNRRLKKHPVNRLSQYGLIRLIYALFALLPIDIASAVGGFLGRKIGPLLKVNTIAQQNVALILPDLSPEAKTTLLRNMWDNLGRTAAEFPHVCRLKGSAFWQRVAIENEAMLPHIKALLTQRKPLIFFSGHFANWEMLPKTSHEVGMPLSLVYRKANNPYVDKLILSARNHYQSEGISKTEGGMRRILHTIRQGKPLGMLVDQRASEGIDIPLLGKMAKTAPAIASLALKYDAILVPIHVARITGKAHFTVHIHEPLSVTRTGDEAKDTTLLLTQINECIGQFILKSPEQWFWVHRRWRP